MINVVISLYYYLLVLKAAFLQEPDEELPAIEMSAPVKILTASLVGVTIVAGIYPHHLIEVARAAVQALL
jgi:NADH-quinone oxidoreductase subunit N